MPREYICHTAEEMSALAAEMAAGLTASSVIALDGPLGAGKTQFVKGLAQGLGCSDTPTSPTFSIAHEYDDGRLTLFHFDFYRMKDVAEITTCGFDDCIGNGVVAVEWASRFPEAFPPDTIRINITIEDNDQRHVSCH